MAQIMRERSGETDRLIFFVDVERTTKLFENPPGRLHHAEAVAVSRMIRARIRQRRHAELADAAQALELGAVEQLEQQRIGRPFQAERDHVMHRISDDLF